MMDTSGQGDRIERIAGKLPREERAETWLDEMCARARWLVMPTWQW